MDTIPTPIKNFLEAVNRHDPDALSAFTADATVDDWGKKLTGITEITAWSNKEFAGSNPTLTITDVKNDGDASQGGSVTITGDWQSDWANGPSAFTFTLDGDKISSMTIREG